MKKKTLQLLSILLLISNFIYGQDQAFPDCVDAIPICPTSNIIDLNPAGTGSVSENLGGCLFTEIGPSSWFYFEFTDDTPPNTSFNFTISSFGGGNITFDLGLYGPNVTCGNLGTPSPCLNQVTSAPINLTVNPGQGYFLYIDRVVGNTTIQIDLGGAGAPFLTCPCDFSVEATAPVTQICENAGSFDLNSVVMGEIGNVIYQWEGDNGAGAYLSDPSSPFPTVTPPAGFTGTLTYRLMVTDDDCENTSMDVVIEVTPLPVIDIAEPNLICSSNDPVTLMASPGAGSGTWGGAAGPGGSIDPSILGPGSHLVTYEYTNGLGCTGSDSRMIVITESPGVEILGNIQPCENEVIEQSAILDGFGMGGSPAYQYNWSTPSGPDINQMVFISGSGAYNLTITDAAGCTAEASEVFVDVLPVPEVDIFDPGFICSSSTFQDIFVGTFESGSGAWDTSTGIIVESGNGAGIIDPSSLGPGSYEVSYTFTSSITGCSNTDVGFIEISSPPTAEITTGGPYCNASDIELFGNSDTNGVTYSWLGPNGFTSSEQNPAAANGPGTYFLTTSIAGCESEEQFLEIQLDNIPIAMADNSGAACSGSSVNLQGSVNITGTTVTYAWTGPDGYMSSEQNPTDATVSGEYNLIVTVDGCASVAAPTMVTINDTPVAMANNSGAACSGSAVNLQGSVNITGTTVTYAWTGPGGYTSNAQNPTDATVSGEYSLIVTVDGCASAAAPTIVTINDAPVAMADNSGAACSGSSVNLQGSVNITGTTVTYAWTGPGGYTSNAQNPTDATVSGEYNLIVTVDGCSSAAAPTMVTINDTPVAMADNSGVACSGSSVNLQGSVNITGTTVTYAWTGPNGYTSSAQNPTDAMVSGEYNLIVTVDGCASVAAPTMVTINDTPVAMADNSGAACSGSSVNLQGSVNITGTTVTYAWTGPGGYTSNAQNPTDAMVSGEYNLIVTVDGCASVAAPTMVTINDTPVAMANNSGAACSGSSVNLQGSVNITGTTVTYMWTGPGGYTSNAQNPTDAMVSGEYNLIVTVDGCASAAAPTMVTINPTPDAVISNVGTFCADEPIQLMGSTTTAGTDISYQWSGPNGYNSTDQNPDDIAIGGNYSLVVTVDDCPSESEMTMVTITPLPIAEPTTGGSLCTSADIELLGNSDTPGVTYAWTGPGGFTSNEQNPATNNGAGVYILTVSNGNCESEPVSLDVNPGTAPQASAGTDEASYCAGDEIGLMGSVNATGTMVEYNWSGPGGYSSTDENPTNATEAGTYTLNVTVDGCVADPADVEVVITDLPLAMPSVGGPYCNAADIELMGDASVSTATYSWTGPNGFMSTEQNPGTVTEGGTYTLTVFDNTCASVPVDVMVILNATPTAQAENTGPYCAGSTIELVDNSSVSGSDIEYMWTGPNGYSSTEQNPMDATESGEYNLVVTVDGCASSPEPTTVIINDLPIAQPSTGGSPCTATTIELLGNSNVSGMGETYSWTGPNGFTSNEQNPSMNNGPGTYFLTVTLNGCSSAAAPLDVNPGAAPVAMADNAGPFCAGDMITLSGTVNATGTNTEYVWTGPNGYSSMEQNPTDATEAGDYELMVTVDGCVSNTAMTTVMINALPIAQPSTGGSPCTATTIELLGNSNVSGMGETYSWTGPNGFTSNEQNPTMNNGAGTYFLTVTLNGCSSTAVPLDVNPGAAPVAMADNAGPFCAGDMITLSGTVNATGTTEYVWTGPNGYSSMEQNPTDATEAGDYELLVTVGGCVSNTAMTTVMINALPIAQPSTGGSPCTATTIELLGNSNVSGMGETYMWTGPNGFTSNEQNPTMNNGAGTYFLTVTLNGCSSAAAPLDVNPGAAPVAMADNAGPFCAGDMITLSGTVNATGMVTEYVWSGPNGYSSDEQNPTDATEGGEYNLVVTVDGCESNTDITTVIINDLPIAQPSTGGSPCTATTIELLGNSNVSGMGETYMWTGPNGFESDERNPTMNNGAGTYFLTVTLNGCSSTAAPLDVNPGAAPVATADNAGPFCAGDMITLSGTVNATGMVTEYVWSGPNGYSSDEQNPTDATEAGEYNLTVTVDDCESNTDITTVIINDLPIAQPSTGGSPCTATTIELLGNSNVSGMGETYSWTGPNGFTSNEQNPTMNNGVGTYFLTVTLNGCSSAAAPLDVNPGAAPVAMADNAGPFCAGDMITLSGTVNATGMVTEYVWSGPNGYSSNEQNPTDATEAGEYNLMVTVDDCESNMDMTTVVINTTPVAELTPDMVTICNTSAEGSTLDFGSLVISGDTGGTWTETTSSGASGNFPNLDFDGVIPGVYTFVYTTNSAIAPCTNPSYTINITIEECACPGVSLSTPAPLCNVNSSVDLSTLVNSGPDGFWTILNTPPGANPASLNNTILEAANADQGTYTLQYTLIDAVPDGCDTEFTVDLEINSSTTAGVSNAPLDFCSDEGNSINLFSELTGADAGGTWTIVQGDAAGFDNSNGIFTTNGQPADTYIFQYELMGNGACPGDTELVTININALPTAEAGMGTTLDCGTSEFMLTANGSTGGDIQISWSGPGMITDGDTYTPTINSSGIFTLTVENTVTGCMSTDVVEILQEDDVPVVNVASANPLTCDSLSVVLFANTDLTTPVDFSWTGPDGFTSGEQYPTVDTEGEYFVTIFNPANNCSSSPALVTVTDESEPPAISILVPLEPLNCATDALLVDASGSQNADNLDFSWTNSDGDVISTAAAFEIMAPGIYELLVTNTMTGCTATESFEIEQDVTEPILSVATPGIINCFDPTVIVTGSSESSGNNPTYNWYDSDGNLLVSDDVNLSVTAAGIYTLEVINGENQCSATTEVMVSAELEVPVINIGNPEMLDCTVTEITLSGEGSATGDNIAYEWQNAANEIIGNDLSVEISSIGNYELIVTNTDNGCTSQEIVEVENNGDDIETALIVTEPSDCFESDNAVIVFSEVVGGTAPFSYTIGDEPLSAQNAYFNLSPGVYEVTVQDALGCEFSTAVTVTEPDPLDLTINLNLEGDESLFFGDSLILSASTEVPQNQIDTLIWDQADLIRCEDEDCFEGVVNNLFDPTNFSATLIDTMGCTTTATVSVGIEKTREIYIPNSFSPNDDGNNDVFVINGGRGIVRINSFRIFNRWGELVYADINFQPNDPDRGWTGMFRNKMVNPAVFVYVAEVEFVDGFKEVYSGDVTVFR